MRHITITCSILFLLLSCFSYGQLTDGVVDKGKYVILKEDTVFNKRSYNLIEYYESGEIKGLVNVTTDSTAAGVCVFFRKDGSILAKGKFVEDKAKGKWKYYDNENVKIRTFNWNWSKGFKPSTWVIIEDGEEILYQQTFWDNGRLRMFKNGRYVGGAKFL